MRKDSEKNDAVSPVVGIMLMLVVTIIVAAVVAAFASGIGASTSVVPSATFEWTLHASGGSYQYPPYVPGNTEQTNWYEPGVVCYVPLSSGDFSSNDLKITTSYTVPDEFEGTTLANAGKTITTTTNGRVEDFGFTMTDITTTYGYIPDTVNGISVPHYTSSVDPFDTTVDRNFVCMTHILPTTGNGATMGSTSEWNHVRFFGGNNIIGSGTTWWFKDISALLGFDITDRFTYGFNEGSVVHITVVHVPTGSVIYDEDVKAVW